MAAVQPSEVSAAEAETREHIRALREAQARLRALIENEPECVKLLDAEGRLLEMNAAGLRMIEAHSAERVCRGERGTLEFELIGLKGTRRWMETHAVPSGTRRGFGLPTMRERAEAHGGSLRLEFPGRGTRVVVEIPAAAHGN